MSDFTLTPEQDAILSEARSPDSLIISALAGAAKTSTLVLLAKKLPLQATLCCAFNKKIADEMAKRMPSHIDCKTMNGIGHGAWARAIGGKRLRVETDKTYTAVSELVKSQPADWQKSFEGFASLIRAVRLCKSSGYVPKAMHTIMRDTQVMLSQDEMADELAPHIDVDPDRDFMHLVDQVLERSIAEAFEGLIDFDDQIYMSVLFGGQFTKYPIIMVDEAQDLSPLNHRMLEKMYGGRVIAVGDPYQSIYGFRGAVMGSMDILKKTFNMKELFLSTSFRCPKAVVERARWRAPHMQYPDWAKEGEVRLLEHWSSTDVPDGAAIICRNNAPLFSTAMKLIRSGRGVKIWGNDVGAGLLKIMDKFGQDSLNQDIVLGQIDQWRQEQLAKSRESRKAAIEDRAECLRVFVEFGSTLGEMKAYVKHLFEATGPVNFMTGHKAKGLEFDTTFHLNPFLIPSKHARRMAEEGDHNQMEQERNLRYVIETRAMSRLFFINTEDFVA